MTRTRFKLAVWGAIGMALLSLFPLYFIYLDNHNIGAWSAWALCVTTSGTLLGYYIRKETERQSEQNQFSVSLPVGHNGKKTRRPIAFA